MGHGLGSDTDSTLSSAPPSPPSSRASSPVPIIPSATAAPPPFGQSRRRKLAAPGPSSVSSALPSASLKSTKPTPKPTKSISKPSTSSISPAPLTQPTLSKKRTYQQRQRSIQLQKAPATAETPASTEDEHERRKPRKRRAQPKPKPDASNSDPGLTSPKPDPAPKRGKPTHRSRPSTSKLPPPSSPTPTQPEPMPLANLKKFETRPPSFLTKAILPTPGAHVANRKPRADIWSYAELDGLVWVKLNLEGGTEHLQVAGDDQTGGNLCWWPAQVTERTPNCLKLILCGSPPDPAATSAPSLELLPSSLSESNVLTFKHASSVRFPTFKTTFFAQPLSTEPELEAQLDNKLEEAWKAARTRALEIDAEKNDGLEDIFLLFSQKTRSERDESVQGSVADPIEAEDDGYRTDEAEILELDSVVLCRYRTRYYPAKICEYYPRGERGPRGKYLCRFADDSTRFAPRHEIHTQLDPGFATCPLGQYTQKASNHPGQSWIGRPPTPEPRASSPEPPEPESTIDTAKYCGLERMRDQLKPVLPFLQGIISRTYIPGQGAGDLEDLLDRHAAYMQGGRARKSLAYSVHTGDLNEDDCEALMYEISRWALRGERWAGGPERAEKTGSDDGLDAIPTIVVDASALDDPTGATNDAVAIPSTGHEDPTPTYEAEIQDTKMVVDPDPMNTTTPTVIQVTGDTVMNDATIAVKDDPDAERNGEVETNGDHAESRSTPDTIAEDAVDDMIPAEVDSTPDNTSFRELVNQQPPRPVGGPEYERLVPEERMGYVSDVLYPEAAALILTYRRGIRTQSGPLPDARAELKLYKAGIHAAKNTAGKEDWVDKILATRQLREAAVHRHNPNDNSDQVVSGGTRSRPKYKPSKSALK